MRVADVCFTVRRLFESGFRVEEGCNAADVDSLAWDAVGVRSAASESRDGGKYWRPSTATRVIRRCDEIECLGTKSAN